MSTTTVRATYANGVLTPLEPLNLTEGCEVKIAVSPPEPSLDSHATSTGDTPLSTGARLLAILDDLHHKHPAGTFDRSPPDFVRNKKHYLYGHAKEDD